MKKLKWLLTVFIPVLFSANLAFADATTPPSQQPVVAASALTPAQVDQVKQIISSYLVENPQILVAASQALQQQMMSQAEQKAKGAIGKYTKEIFNDPRSPVVGNTKGTVTLVEFMDYQCVHCRDMYPILEALIKEDGNLKVVIKELPIFGGSSTYAAEAALAAYKQGAAKFSAFHNALFDSETPLTKASILAAAKKVGLNTALLQKEMTSDAVKEEIKNNFALAQNLALIGTPAFVLGNQDASKTAFIPGATTKDGLQQAISQLK